MTLMRMINRAETRKVKESVTKAAVKSGESDLNDREAR